jgi:hypothetical protein
MGKVLLRTAEAGSRLKVLGETPEPLKLKVLGTTYPISPIVIDGLDADLNISGPLLKTLGWILNLAEGTITDAAGNKIPLAGSPMMGPAVQAIRLPGPIGRYPSNKEMRKA